jgi:hypothetical protein
LSSRSNTLPALAPGLVLLATPAVRRRTAFVLFFGLLVVYNLNGREVGTVDSQPTKFAARELAVRGTLTLDRVIEEKPGLATRSAFTRDREGHWRSAYPIVPALVAGMVGAVLHHIGILDLDAPLAANLVAVGTASLATAAAVTLVFLALARMSSLRVALVTAIGLGLGTNYWPLVSRTLWQHEMVAFGLALALWAWLRPSAEIRTAHLTIGGAGLALAGAARPQVAPLVLFMFLWLAHRVDLRRAVIPACMVIAAAALTVGANILWFGGPLGALPRLEAVHPAVHGVDGPINRRFWIGAAGLLVAPNRGLLIFSPIALVALFGFRTLHRSARDLGLWWLTAGVFVQFIAYSAYAVWWGGHTYGPRYMLDVLVPLAAVAAKGAERLMSTTVGQLLGAGLLAWSIAVAGIGAFVYPNERWNTSPADVDLNHQRLWDVHDLQIRRAYAARPSPQNFDLFTKAAVSREP